MRTDSEFAIWVKAKRKARLLCRLDIWSPNGNIRFAYAVWLCSNPWTFAKDFMVLFFILFAPQGTRIPGLKINSHARYAIGLLICRSGWICCYRRFVCTMRILHLRAGNVSVGSSCKQLRVRVAEAMFCDAKLGGIRRGTPLPAHTKIWMLLFPPFNLVPANLSHLW